jgi:hypothetical protein
MVPLILSSERKREMTMTEVMPTHEEIRFDRPRYEDYPDFEPDLSPLAMARMGVFGGSYFADDIDDCRGIPQEILDLQRGEKSKANNAYRAHSGLSREEWEKRGWLSSDNPRGWYQWYCRFHEGERFPENREQVNRWKDFRRRWSPKTPEALQRMNPKAGTRQALLHWGLDPFTPEKSAGVEI